MFGQIASQRKTAWGQISEENFIKYDLPMFVYVNKFSLEHYMTGYLRGLPLRRKWWRGSHNRERLDSLARMVLREPPRIWYSVEEGTKQWYIQYEGDSSPKKYYFR